MLKMQFELHKEPKTGFMMRIVEQDENQTMSEATDLFLREYTWSKVLSYISVDEEGYFASNSILVKILSADGPSIELNLEGRKPYIYLNIRGFDKDLDDTEFGIDFEEGDIITRDELLRIIRTALSLWSSEGGFTAAVAMTKKHGRLIGNGFEQVF